jgi:predicted ArsR family transcriptional regulator
LLVSSSIEITVGILRMLHVGPVTRRQVSESIGCHISTAEYQLDYLKELGVVRYGEVREIGKAGTKPREFVLARGWSGGA